MIGTQCGVGLKPPINRAMNSRQRAQMRLEYRLINVMGLEAYGRVQPLLEALLEASEDVPAAVPQSIVFVNPWTLVK